MNIIECNVKYRTDYGHLESIWKLLVYVPRTYDNLNPYLEGLDLTIHILRPYWDEEGWEMRGDVSKLVYLDVRWGLGDEDTKAIIVTGVLWIKEDMVSRDNTTIDKVTTKLQLRAYG